MVLSLPTNELRARLRASLEALATSVDRTRQDEGFREFLRTAARFWEYSPFNQFLIELQRPRAVRVAGRRTWESLKRRVKEGELPISILAPSGGGGFILVPVFDLSQTRGRKLPNIDPAMRGVARVRVLAHELGHELLHQEARQKPATLKRPPKPRSPAVEETEADATAFIVLSALGLEAPSPSYIAWQGGTGAQVLLSMGRIQRAARRILAAAQGPA